MPRKMKATQKFDTILYRALICRNLVYKNAPTYRLDTLHYIEVQLPTKYATLSEYLALRAASN